MISYLLCLFQWHGFLAPLRLPSTLISPFHPSVLSQYPLCWCNFRITIFRYFLILFLFYLNLYLYIFIYIFLFIYFYLYIFILYFHFIFSFYIFILYFHFIFSFYIFILFYFYLFVWFYFVFFFWRVLYIYIMWAMQQCASILGLLLAFTLYVSIVKRVDPLDMYVLSYIFLYVICN